MRNKSMSSNNTSPGVMRPADGSSRMIDSIVVVLPQPDSPTRPSVWPGYTSNETSSTARAGALIGADKLRRQMPHAQ